MARKFYTLDDLYNFCKENRFELEDLPMQDGIELGV